LPVSIGRVIQHAWNGRQIIKEQFDLLGGSMPNMRCVAIWILCAFANTDGIEMSSYKDIKKGIKPKYERGGRCYADGGRVATKRAGGKTVINIVTAPAQPAAPAMPPAPPPPPPPAPAGGPGGMPPAGAAAMQAMGAGGPPMAFKRGGRVKAGAASGEGRLQNAAKQKRGGK
jgi:hypothetical protein